MVKILPHTTRFIEVFNKLKADKKLPSNAELAEAMGMKSGNTLTEIKARRQNISLEQLQKFCDLMDLDFAYYSGTSQKNQGKQVIPLGKKVPMRLTADQFADAFPDWKGLPVYDVPISASFIQHYTDETTYEPKYHLRDPRFKDCTFAAIVTGDSMHSEIRHGDYVVCQEITDWSFIVFGDIYYVSAKNGMETCKYVHPDGQDRDSILLVPKNEKIPSSPLKKKMINKLYKVKGIIRGY
jgi:SOS-response transcriptional repressor LexA